MLPAVPSVRTERDAQIFLTERLLHPIERADPERAEEVSLFSRSTLPTRPAGGDYYSGLQSVVIIRLKDSANFSVTFQEASIFGDTALKHLQKTRSAALARACVGHNFCTNELCRARRVLFGRRTRRPDNQRL